MREYAIVNGQKVRVKKSFLHRAGRAVLGVLAAVGAFAIIFMVAGSKLFDTSPKVKNSGSREAIIEEEEKFHGIILTNETLVAELNSISELMTYSQVYAGQASIVDSVQLPYTDFDIWGTQHTIDVMYSGTIKVGYELKDIKIVVNNQKKEIYITLPKNPIVDNNLPQENVTCYQDNNIFNPIRANEVNARLAEIKDEQLQNAVNNGIFKKAETHMKESVIETLARLHSDYKVVFLDQIGK